VPSLSWSIDPATGDITLDASGLNGHKIKSVKKQWATTCNGERRDFRIATVDDPCPCGFIYEGTCTNLKSFWSHEEVAPVEEGVSVYVGHHDVPEDGRWAAFMLEVTYEKPDGWDEEREAKGGDRDHIFPRATPGELMFTTEVSIVPNVFPFPEDCYLDSCNVPLV